MPKRLVMVAPLIGVISGSPLGGLLKRLEALDLCGDEGHALAEGLGIDVARQRDEGTADRVFVVRVVGNVASDLFERRSDPLRPFRDVGGKLLNKRDLTLRQRIERGFDHLELEHGVSGGSRFDAPGRQFIVLVPRRFPGRAIIRGDEAGAPCGFAEFCEDVLSCVENRLATRNRLESSPRTPPD